MSLTPDGQGDAASAPPMRHVVASGMFWMVTNVILSRGISFLSQLILGWVLSKGDFGLYAIAISFASLLSVFRDGGLRPLLIQRRNEYETLRGPLFWMSASFNLLTALALVAASPLAVHFYRKPGLYALLWVNAAAVALSTPGVIAAAKLAADLRFRTTTRIALLSDFLRQTLSVVFALLGMGPLSFVLPLLVTAVYEAIAGYIATRDAPWRASPRLDLWGGLLGSVKWIIAGTLASCLIVRGDSLSIGRLETEDIVGVYFFAYQLSVQIHQLLATNLQNVLLPALSRFQDDPRRQGVALVRALSALAVVAFPAMLWLAVCAEPVERLCWHGKWAAAVPVVQVLCIALGWRSVTAAVKPLLEAQGQFRLYFFIGLADGLANVAAGFLGAFLGGLTSISIAIALYSALSGIGEGFFVARVRHLSFKDLMRGQTGPWLLSLAVAAAVLSLSRYVLPPMHPLAAIALRSFLFAAFYALGALLLLRPILNDLLATLPRRSRA